MSEDKRALKKRAAMEAECQLGMVLQCGQVCNVQYLLELQLLRG